MARVLLLSSQPVLGGDIIKSLLTKGDADLAKIDVITNSASLGKGAMGSERYVAVFAFAEDQSTHSHTFLAEIQKSLAPGGAVTIVEKDHMVITTLLPLDPYNPISLSCPCFHNHALSTLSWHWISTEPNIVEENRSYNTVPYYVERVFFQPWSLLFWCNATTLSNRWGEK